MGQESMQSAQGEVAPVSVEELTKDLDKLKKERDRNINIFTNTDTPTVEAIASLSLVENFGKEIDRTNLMIERATRVDEIAIKEDFLKEGAELMGKRGDRATSTERMEWVAFYKNELEVIAEHKRRIAEIDMKLARFVPRNTETQQVEEVA